MSPSDILSINEIESIVNIDFNWIFNFSIKDVDWHDAFEHQLNTPFDNVNLTRWMLIDGHILIMAFHHAIVDAKNLFFIGRQYLSLCLSIINDRTKRIHLEPMEKYLVNEYSFEPISDLDMIPRPGRSESNLSQTRVRHFFVSNSILIRLQDQCHGHHIRLNSILSVISAMSFYLASHVYHEQTLKIHMMVNIRSQLELNFEDTGMFATVFDCFLRFDQDSLASIWQQAKEQHVDLHRRIHNREYIVNCKNDTDLLRMINAHQSFSSDDVHFAFSNLGLLSNTNENHIQEHYFGVSLIEQRWTSAILLGISTINDQLCFTITYNKHKISANFIDQWIEQIQYLLKQI
jgi:hypothetical protein